MIKLDCLHIHFHELCLASTCYANWCQGQPKKCILRETTLITCNSLPVVVILLNHVTKNFVYSQLGRKHYSVFYVINITIIIIIFDIDFKIVVSSIFQVPVMMLYQMDNAPAFKLVHCVFYLNYG